MIDRDWFVSGLASGVGACIPGRGGHLQSRADHAAPVHVGEDPGVRIGGIPRRPRHHDRRTHQHRHQDERDDEGLGAHQG